MLKALCSNWKIKREHLSLPFVLQKGHKVRKGLPWAATKFDCHLHPRDIHSLPCPFRRHKADAKAKVHKVKRNI